MTLDEIERRYPEWAPSLDAVRELLAEIDDPHWDAAVPALGSPHAGAPLIASTRLAPFDYSVPLLHACRRRWAGAVPAGWAHGYCPVCGAWPGFAELCGVERTRYLRCLRCGSAWRAHGLACAYCANTDHDALGSLLPAEGPPKWAIELCHRCHGYLKTFTRLTVGTPQEALLEDLASIELDFAAEARGYRRPKGTGHDPG